MAGGEVQGLGAPLREAQGAAPGRQDGLLQLDREPALALRVVSVQLKRLTARSPSAGCVAVR